MKVSNLIEELVNIGEKGANVARIIRSDHRLLNLLVQEKKGEQKNDRFVKDFKTLADVLVQQIVCHDLSCKFPGLKNSIYGEESNKFTNALGETIRVEILSTSEETAALLCTVLNGDKEAADLLAKVCHEGVHHEHGEKLNEIGSLELNEEDIGVWIDPIDSTAQYIKGVQGVPNGDGIIRSGLQSSSVLIGVYNKHSGLPIAGIINQPFACKENNSERWISSCQWGVCTDGCSVYSVTSNVSEPSDSEHILLTSASDAIETNDKFSKKYTIHHASGAGYKLLCVIQGLVDAYVLSKGSTFKWDICAPHAILLSQGGGVISYKSLCDLAKSESANLNDMTDYQIVYNRGGNSDVKQWCNSEGIVAYSSKDCLKRLVDTFKTS